MWDERNAEDTRLLAAGDHAKLLATYYEIILGRRLERGEVPDEGCLEPLRHDRRIAMRSAATVSGSAWRSRLPTIFWTTPRPHW